tara:strand:+ start:59 stop:232 length:174 start_codon:yes stop_codon:yes gene_type:complete
MKDIKKRIIDFPRRERVWKEEDKKDNIIRGGDKSNVSNLVNDKLNLKHNKNVSDILA